MTSRDQLHHLVDALPVDAFGRCRTDALRAVGPTPGDPVTSALAKAPMDDEPVTPSVADAITAGERDVEDGRVVSAVALRVRLGL